MHDSQRRDVFRDNLHRLAHAHGLDFDGLARGLGYIRDDKKWLRRLWRDGLDQPDGRRRDELDRLAGFLGLWHHRQLWEEGIEVSPQAMKTGNREEFVRIIARTHELIRTIDALNEKFPNEMDQILFRYKPENSEFDRGRCERLLVAEWIADGYGIRVGDQIREVKTQFDELIEDYDISLAIIEELQTHPRWEQFVAKHGSENQTTKFVMEQWRVSSGQGKKQGHPITPDLFANVFRQHYLDEQPHHPEKIVRRTRSDVQK